MFSGNGKIGAGRVFIVVGLVLSSGNTSAETIYVNDDAVGNKDGTSWRNAHISLASAIERAKRADEVWVARGMYRGPISLKSGVKIYGGFGGSETQASASRPAVNRTIISGGGRTRAVVGSSIDSSAVLRGFYITDGFVDLPNYGAGMELRNCDAKFVSCVFEGNRSRTLGGALANWGGSPTFVNCRFQDNSARFAAGAVFNRDGGAPVFINCLFARNEALEAGAIGNLDGSGTYLNCTFSSNRATAGKGGAIVDHPGKTMLRNCILWGNTAVLAGSEAIFNHPHSRAQTDSSNCNIQGGWPGDGNLASDPRFVDAANGDFRIKSDSPCRDAGNAQSLPLDSFDLDWNGQANEALSIDLDRKNRIEGTTVDIGAFEWHP